MTQCNTEYTNFLPLFSDLKLDPDIDMLYMLHRDSEHLTIDKFQNKQIWSTRKNIYLIDCESGLVTKDLDWQKDTRVYTWTPTVTNHDRSYTYHFWFDWLQDIESYLSCFKKINKVKTKSYYFDALLGTPRTHKDIVMEHIKSSKHRENFLISYNGNPTINPDCIWLPGSEYEDNQMMVVYNNNQVTYSACVIPYKIYNQCWYSLVAENSEEQPNFYTEKTGKPLLSKRLFVMFAGQHHLKHLREFGFKTFDGIIDESYDDIENLETRYQQAWKQVEFLLEQDPIEIYKLAEPILEHNRNHFITTDWQKEMHEKIQNISRSSK